MWISQKQICYCKVSIFIQFQFQPNDKRVGWRDDLIWSRLNILFGAANGYIGHKMRRVHRIRVHYGSADYALFLFRQRYLVLYCAQWKHRKTQIFNSQYIEILCSVCILFPYWVRIRYDCDMNGSENKQTRDFRTYMHGPCICLNLLYSPLWLVVSAFVTRCVEWRLHHLRRL